MANVAPAREARPDRLVAPPSARRTISVADARSSPFAADQAVQGIHPQAFRLPLIATAWLILAMAISFTHTLETGYLMAIIIGFAIIFFGLTIGLAMHASGSAGWLGSRSSFRRFVQGEVRIHTGTISGHEARVQLTVLPVTLALGGMAIGLVYLLVR